MADLRTDFAGIKSPNPFWLASGPPTNTYVQVAKAFDQGWGGAVWKTIGEPIINVFSRYGSVDLGQNRMMGFNNIELISDRPIVDNLKEIAEVKRNYPKHAVIASLMVESKREAWHAIVKQTEDTGADGIELNFGCPHGMSERGMGSAVGQVPDYTCQIVEWVKEVATIPVIVKLTPNVTDITYIARAAVKGGADALSLINTNNSIVGVDLSTFEPQPSVARKSSHGGYCGPAVKPIALHLVSEVAGDPAVKIPIFAGARCPGSRNGRTSTSTTTCSRTSIRTSASSASCAGRHAKTALTKRFGVWIGKRETGNVGRSWRSSRRPASGAICARRCARCRIASRCERSRMTTHRLRGRNTLPVRASWRRALSNSTRRPGVRARSANQFPLSLFVTSLKGRACHPELCAPYARAAKDLLC